MLRDFPQFLLFGELRRESDEQLMAGLPERPQLEEHHRAETAAHIAEQVAERIELFLDADGGALLLFEPVAQQMQLIL